MKLRAGHKVTFYIPNPKTGRNVAVICTYDYTSDGEEWWDLQARDEVETRSSAPKGVIAEGQVVFDPLEVSDYGNMHEPHAYVMRGGAGLCLYMAAALLAGKRGRRGIRASDCLSGESHRLWEKMVMHGLATNRGLDVGPVGALLAATVRQWIADYRKQRGGV